MIRRLVLRILAPIASQVLAMLLVSTLQCAAGQTVRSGEHADFSRLVFDINPPVPWHIVSVESGYVLTIDSQDHPANLSGIYRFIPRKRLKSVSAVEDSPGQYRLNIADGFHAEALEISPGTLVIDIKPGAAEPKQAVPDLPEPIAQQDVRQPLVQRIKRRSTDSGVMRAPAVPTDPVSQELNGAASRKTKKEVQPLPDIVVLRAQESLVRQLGRAMTQGVVSPSSNSGPGASRLAHSSSGTSVSRQTTSVAPSMARKPITHETDGAGILPEATQTLYLDHLNLQAQTVFDREINDRVSRAQSSLRGAKCIDDSELDVGSWSPEGGAGAAISEMRSALIGEFDRADPKDLTSLVRLYVAEGMGTEALALMKNFKGEKIKDVALMSDLAQIIETGVLPYSQILADQASCPGAVAMWALLARPDIPLGEVPDTKNLNEHFSRLPVGLRRRIGPLLGTKLLGAGFIEMAEGVERLISRAPGKDGPTLGLFRAKIDLARNRTSLARAKLSKIVAANRANAPDAALLLIETYLTSSEAIPETLITEVSARAFELRRSALGQKLLQAELMALSRMKRQMSALEILTHESDLETIDPPTATALVGRIFSTFDPSDLDAAQFTRTFFRFRNLLSPSPEQDPARRHIVNTLIAVGLPGVALDVLVPLSGRITDADRLLYGQIALARGKPEESLSVIEVVQSPAADVLRIRAFSALGKYGRAFALADSINIPIDPEIPILAWRAGEWRFVAANDKTPRGSAAAYVVNDPENEQAPEFARHLQAPQALSLTALSDLLEQSRASRDVLQALLADNPRP